ncbi:MAG: tyrosine-type recombinase/integrase, partial [Clostridium sp.]
FKSINTFLTVYLQIIRAKSSNTISAYRDTLNLFITFLKDTKNLNLSEIMTGHFNSENIVSFLDWLEISRNNSISTRNQRLISIRAFCRYIADENILSYDLYSRIEQINKKPVADRGMKDILSVADIKLILEMPDVSKKIGIRDRFYIALLYDSACRDQEILDLKLSDIQVEGIFSSLKIIGKGTKFRVTPISKEVTSMFNQYIDLFHPNRNMEQYLFYTTRKGITGKMSADNVARFLNSYEKLAKKVRISLPHLHPHLFRHARAMHLYQSGMPLALVSQWLGHSQLETSLIYAYADTEMKRAAADKMVNAENGVFTNDAFIYQDDEDTIKKLYGLK